MVFVKRRTAKRQRAEGRRPHIEEQLTERGVTPGAATRLVREFGADLISQKIEAFDRLMSCRDKRVSRNPAGYLVQSIRENYQSSEYHRREPRRRTETSPEQGSALRLEENRAASAEQTRIGPIHEYLSRLSPMELGELEQTALESAPRFVTLGYHRAKASGNMKLLDEYRGIIVERHVEGLLSRAAEAA